MSPAHFRERLVALLEPQADERLAAAERPTAVIRDLRLALQAAGNDDGKQLDAWIARHLVDRGPMLLVSDSRRKAVLAYVRDGERRARRRASPERFVKIAISEDVASRLGAYMAAHRMRTQDAAIALLLRNANRKSRGSGSGATPLSTSDLFGAGKDGGSTENA
ncbi:MAG: hypothetical protein JSR21_21595 [Proteobacteria bacterium]|nr:hypothetical protein [Pseudomonadota bacterium]